MDPHTTEGARDAAGLSSTPSFVWTGRLGSLLFRALASTWRIEWQIDPAARRLLEAKTPVVFSVFHEVILVGIWCFRRRDITVMVSQSKDGEIVSQIIHRLGYTTARGSSSRGGGRALLEIARLGRRGRSLAITPDGPRGPRRRMQQGLLLIGQRSGLPILPLGFGARRRRRLKSWDRMVVPWPFARVVAIVGAPIDLPAELSLEQLLADHSAPIERVLIETQREADRWARDPEGE